MSRSEEFEQGGGRPARPVWHVTSRKNFKPSDAVRPTTRNGMPSRTPGLYSTTDPSYWVNIAGGASGVAFAERRKWAAELDVSEHPALPHEDILNPERVLDPTKVKVKRIIPVPEAIAETTGYHPTRRESVPKGYRYPGPDFPEKKPRKPKTP